MEYFQKRINEDLDFINNLKNSSNDFEEHLEENIKNHISENNLEEKIIQKEDPNFYSAVDNRVLTDLLPKVENKWSWLDDEENLEENIQNYIHKNDLDSYTLKPNNIKNIIPSGTFLSTVSSSINKKLISDLEKKVNLNKKNFNQKTNLFDIFYNDLKTIDEYFNIYKFHHFKWMESYSEENNENIKIEEDNKKTLDSILNHFSEKATNTINEITKNYIGEKKQIKFLEFLENNTELTENSNYINYNDLFTEIVNYSALRIDCITDEINLIENNKIFFDDDVKMSYI